MNVITPEQLLTLRELAESMRQQIERGEDVSQSQQRSFATICFALPDLVDMIHNLEDRCGLHVQAIASNYQAYQGENTALRQKLEKAAEVRDINGRTANELSIKASYYRDELKYIARSRPVSTVDFNWRDECHRLRNRAEEALRKETEIQRGECHWHLGDEDWGDWESACGLEWYLEGENPKENEMVYCPKCGKVIVVDPQE